jgi:hypothetical protein
MPTPATTTTAGLVIPRIIYLFKGTRKLLRLIRKQQARQREREERRRLRRMEREERRRLRRRDKKRKSKKLSLREMHRTFGGCNEPRAARPRAGALKDRENSDPSDGDEEMVVTLTPAPKPAATVPIAVNHSVVIDTIAAPIQDTAPFTTRSCRRLGRRSLADVEHSAGSDDEERVLPHHSQRAQQLSDSDAAAVLLSFGWMA